MNKGIISVKEAEQYVKQHGHVMTVFSPKTLTYAFVDEPSLSALKVPIHFMHSSSMLPRSRNKEPINSVVDLMLVKYKGYELALNKEQLAIAVIKDKNILETITL